jgi:hypothetical protein
MTTWLKPSRKGLGPRNDSGVRLTISTSKGKDNIARHHLNFRVRQDAMKAMRWVAGDRLAIGYDDDGTFTMRRDLQGFKLTATNTGMEGKCVPAVLKCALPHFVPPNMAEQSIPLDECVIDGIDLCFSPEFFARQE